MEKVLMRRKGSKEERVSFEGEGVDIRIQGEEVNVRG
jgi:hypothetical protein